MHWYGFINNGPHRVNHAAVAIEHNIYSFGGYSACECHDESNGYIIVSRFNTETLSWAKVSYSSKCKNSVPCELYGHSVVEYKGKIYLWGGQSVNTKSNAIYCFDPEILQWSLPETSGKVPVSRDGHTASVVNDHMYIIGGFCHGNYGLASMKSILRLNLRTFYWEIIAIEGWHPFPKDFHTASVIGSKIYMFGGREIITNTENVYTEDEFYDENMYCFDVELNIWSCLEITDMKPFGRRSHSAVVFQNQIYIFFGYNFILDVYFNDIHRFNPENEKWTSIIPKYNDEQRTPCKRRRQCCVLVDSRMFVFGGVSPQDCVECQHYPSHSSSNPLLAEHSDLYIFDFLPTLKNLCMFQVMHQKLNYDLLPTNLKTELMYFITGECHAMNKWCSYC